MPTDACRSGDDSVVHFDLPGVDPETLDPDVERNVLDIHAERTHATHATHAEEIPAARLIAARIPALHPSRPATSWDRWLPPRQLHDCKGPLGHRHAPDRPGEPPSPPLLTNTLAQLPPVYALLFGPAQVN